MRRVASSILLVIGGWWLSSQMAVAFVDVQAGLSDNLLLVGIVAGIAAVPLLLGTWASPGNRRRELGLTMLIATGATLFMLLALAAMVMDRALMRYMPPIPEIAFAPVVGAANLLVLAAAGWWLYRGSAAPVQSSSQSQ